jgi:PAS domain S-box-containing protein
VSLKRLKLIGIFFPVIFLLMLDLIRHRFWFHALHTWPGLILSGLGFTVLSVAFTEVMFDRILALDATNVRLRAEAQEALAFLENLVQNSADAVIMTTIEGQIALWNEGAETIYGFSRAEAVGSPPIMVPPERRHEIAELLGRVKQGEIIRNFETHRLHKDGRQIDVILTLTPVRNAEGEVVAALGISKDVTRAKQLERQTQHLALFMDRERICMDLHDSIIQSIYAAGLQLEGCAERVEREPQTVRLQLDRAIEALHAINRDIRSYIMGLRPDLRGDCDLAVGLAGVLSRFEANSLVHARLRVSADVSGLNTDQVGHLLQITREALSNVTRHALATAVEVTVDSAAAGVHLTIQDNGCGWDPDIQRNAEQMGVRNMETRARSAGGALQIESRLGAGTTVIVTVPCLNQATEVALAERVVP